jgi:hypothetical protein
MITKLIILSVPVFITQPKTAGSFQLKLNPVEIEINNGMLQMMSQLKISNPLYFQNSFVATFIDSPEFPVVKHQRYTVTVVFQIPAVCFDGTTDFDRFDPYFNILCTVCFHTISIRGDQLQVHCKGWKYKHPTGEFIFQTYI